MTSTSKPGSLRRADGTPFSMTIQNSLGSSGLAEGPSRTAGAQAEPDRFELQARVVQQVLVADALDDAGRSD